jgi:DNA repair exonuclease SbcCD ATPase subunit
MKYTIIKHTSPLVLALMILVISGGIMSVPSFAQSNSASTFSMQQLIPKDWFGKGKRQMKRGMHEMFGSNINMTVLENQATKYNLDSKLVEDIKTDQEKLKKTLEVVMNSKKQKQQISEELKTTLKDDSKSLQDSVNKFHEAWQQARKDEAIKLGVNQSIIDSWLGDQEKVKEHMNTLIELRSKDETTVKQIREARENLKESVKTAKESRKAFDKAIREKGGISEDNSTNDEMVK